MNERLKVYEDKMNKTMANLDGELGTIRAGRANPECTEPDQGGLLRDAVADSAGGECVCAGGAHDSDSAMGEEYAESH